MYTLVSGAYRYLTRQDEYKILMLGLDGSGKTTLLEQIKHIYLGVPRLPSSRIRPTIGVNLAKITINRTLLRFMDLGGHSELQDIWASYFDDCHALLYVIDCGDRDRLDESLSVLLGLLDNKELEGLPVLVLANKCELTKGLSLAEVKEGVNGMADAMDGRDVRVVSSSGVEEKEVGNLRAAVDWLFARIVDNKIALSRNSP